MDEEFSMSINRQTEILELKHGPTTIEPAASPVSVGTSSTLILAARTDNKRKHVVLQNNGTEPCIIRLGEGASTTTYNITLSKATAARDGLGGSITIENYQGIIHGIVGSNTTEISVLEMLNG